jgi:hypothetical protein
MRSSASRAISRAVGGVHNDRAGLALGVVDAVEAGIAIGVEDTGEEAFRCATGRSPLRSGE